MSKEDLKFEEYFRQKLLDDHEILKNVPYTEKELREIYRQNWEWERNAPDLALSLEPQQLDYDTTHITCQKSGRCREWETLVF